MNKDESLCQPSTSKRFRKDNRSLTEAELLNYFEESDNEFDLVVASESESNSDDDKDDLLGEETNEDVQEVPRGITSEKLWLPTAPDRTRIPFSANPGLKVVMDSHKPIDFFNLFFNDRFYELVVNNSNLYAVEILSRSMSEQSRIAAWKDLSKDEFKIFLGLLFHMGTIKINRINDYWKTNFLFSVPVFSTFMSRNRFLLILRAMHFTTYETEEQNKLAKIRPLLNLFNTTMEEVYYPSRELALDESMVLWKGRLGFRQYLQNKRHKYGIKLYVLAEPTGMVQKILVYGGSADPDVGGAKHTIKVVQKLMEGKTGVGHALYMDNFYNSLDLSTILLQGQTYTTGTLRGKRLGNPKNVLTKKLGIGESYCEYTEEGACICKWKDRREVLAISTEFGGEMVQTTSKRGVEKLKPKLIAEYNKFMGGVDHCDQMLQYYCCEHKVLRWYKKLGVHLFQIMLINSHFLYNKYGQKKMNLYEFRLSIIESLLGPPPPKREAQNLVYHLPEYCPKDDKGNAKRRRCKYCWQTNKTRKDSTYFCPQCPNEPGLCLTPCFRQYHSS